MRLQVAKWGNRLAVRLPVECVRAAGLRAGDRVEVEITPAGEIALTAAKRFGKTAFLDRMRKLHAKMSMTEPVVEQTRREVRY